jgi:sensor histidine kinase YesM
VEKLLALYYLFQSRQKEKQVQYLKESNFEKQIAEVQMQALRSQMNPHFLFNSLNSIKHYVINKDKRDAANYLTKFSKLVRNILQNSNHSLVPLEKELELIKLYMEIEAMRFENPFEIEIDVDEQLNTDQVFLPPMLLQPYVENAIWHGLRYKEKDGKITIKVMQNEIGIICSIEDNGVGRVKAAEIRDQNLIQKKSMGTTITKNRIELINKLFNKTATEETIDLFNDKKQAAGTRVLLHIPNFTSKDYHGSKN